MFTTATVSPLNLYLDENNPRFRVNVSPSQDDIRKYMFKHEKLLVLANSMTKMNTILPGERVIIFNDGVKNIVLEGNRRTSIYQMLLDRSLIPSEVLSSFPKATMEFLSEISNLPVDVVNNREEAMAFLAARHIIGVQKWSSVSKWKISYEYYKNNNTINEISERLVMPPNTVRTSIRNYKILLRGLRSPNWTDEENARLSPLDIEPDRLIRVFWSKDTINRLDLFYSNDYELLSHKFDQETITKLIVLLTKMAFITGEVNTRRSITEEKIWSHIISVIPELDSSRGTATGTSGTATGTSGTATGTSGTATGTSGTGGKKNVPYFFDGLRYGHLDRMDAATHGVIRVCDEIRKFSKKEHVKIYPIAAAFLTRSLIEQSLTYYAKTHDIQGQTKRIWERVCENKKTPPQLSDIINSFNKNLPDYITDANIRGYFSDLFKDYNALANPLNWVVHRPDEFVLDSTRLCELPGNGLLKVINYLLDEF